MNKALSITIGLAVLAAVAWVSYRIWEQQGSADAASSEWQADPEATRQRESMQIDVSTLDVPKAREAAAAGDDEGVAGVVLLPDGVPASGATVRLHRALSPWPEWEREELETVFTSGSGTFWFQTPRGPDLLVSFEHADYVGDLVRAPPENPRLTLRLEPGFEVAGFVLNDIGTGVGGAAVSLEPTVTDTRRARTQQNEISGYFRFTNVRAGSVRVVARHPLYQPAILPLVTVGASTGLELRFEQQAFAPLQGSVIAAATGEPVAEAEVRALPNSVYRGLFDPLIARTDEKGAFRIRGLGRGNLRLEVRHPDYSTVSRPIAVSSSTTSPLFELTPRSQVRGRLAGYPDFSEDRLLTLLLRTTAGEMQRTPVSEDGTFAFAGSFSSGPATIEVQGGALAFERTSSFDTHVRIEDAPRTELLLRVVPPSVVLGRVIGPGGDPVAGARILLPGEFQKLLAPARLLAVTDGDGSWRVRGLPAGTIDLLVSHDEYADQRIAVEVPAPGATHRAGDVLLELPGSISGRVVRGGRGLAGALVSVTSGTTTAETVSRGSTGSFLLTGLPPGTYRVRARYSTLPLVLADRPAEVLPGEVVGPITLSFESGRRVTGIVVGSDDQPIEGAIVTVLEMAGAGSFTETDSTGRFSLEVPGRNVEIQAFVGDRSINRSVTLEQGQESVVLELDTPPTASLVAHVYALPGRKQISAGLLRIETEDGSSFTRHVEMSGGELRHPSFPSGKSRLTLQCEGYTPFVREVAIPPGGEYELGEILLEPGSTLSGRVVDESGLPVANAVVFLGEETDLRLYQPQTHSGHDGRFRLSGVSTRSKRLVVHAPGFATRTLELELPRDVLRSDPLLVMLDEGARIEVQVLEADGRPREGGFVLLLRDDRLLDYTYCNEEGVAVFPHRGPDRYEVRLFGHQDLHQQVEVTDSGQTYRVVLR